MIMKVITIIFVLPMLIGLISGEFLSKKEKPWEASTNNHYKLTDKIINLNMNNHYRYVGEKFDALEYYKNKRW
ncbi:hypothetical protein [Tepidibacillus fermentans]|uniref:Uncharacterized protein n=1 Tax=Tepidibacillus fermentans TaxID=1281767 RepID=A0A4R3KNE4_9BACI|nr:hypothetical protein [Tepidibacillus fermentans]TCS84548.1 hypothetical protein EDD72_101217 [Tepidibacillus fermentans]